MSQLLKPPAPVARRPPYRAISPGGRRANKGLRYRADPPTVEEIVAVMRQAGDGAHGASYEP